MAYMLIYANPGKDEYTSLEIDLNLTDTQYAILSGVAYVLINGVFSLLSGVLVDRLPRKILLLGAGIVWSLLTLAQSFSFNFVTILIPRMFSAVAISLCNVC